MKDDNGEKVSTGDTITFSYGIPPVRVQAPVERIGRELWVLTPGHTPDRCRLSQLRKYVGAFYKI